MWITNKCFVSACSIKRKHNTRFEKESIDEEKRIFYFYIKIKHAHTTEYADGGKNTGKLSPWKECKITALILSEIKREVLLTSRLITEIVTSVACAILDTNFAKLHRYGIGRAKETFELSLREIDREILYNLLYRDNLTSGGDIQVAASLRPALAMGRSYALAGDRPGIFPPPIHPSRSSIGDSPEGLASTSNTKHTIHRDTSSSSPRQVRTTDYVD